MEKDEKDVIIRLDRQAHQKAKKLAAKRGQTLKGYLKTIIEKDAGKENLKKPESSSASN